MEHHYHVIEFHQRVEAAAFVAALSRFLNSPRAAEAERLEVWSQSDASNEAVTLYLTDTALQAAEDAFSPVPVTGTCEALPEGTRLVLGGGPIPAWGLRDAERNLLQE